MLYVFEGPRNSGKSFLSDYISKKFDIQRYQFSFAEYFSRLNMESQNSREAHAFSMGKELMIMQLFKEMNVKLENGADFSFIHDRGILTVLAWGIMEGRITESEMENQIQMLFDLDLMRGITFIFITGDNPNKNDRNKDQWDRIDGDSRELESYLKVISKISKYGNARIFQFKNTFDDNSLLDITQTFENILIN
jgi:hypothetical protein